MAAPPTAQQLAALRRGAEVEGALCVPKLAEAIGGGSGDGGGARDGSGSVGRGPGGSDASSGGGGGGGRVRPLRGGGGHGVRVVVSEGKKHEVGRAPIMRPASLTGVTC